MILFQMLSLLLTTIFHLDVTGTNLAVVYSPLLKKGLLPNRKQDLKSELIEILSVEITVKKGKWMVHTVYRPPSSDLALFLSEPSKSLITALVNMKIYSYVET